LTAARLTARGLARTPGFASAARITADAAGTGLTCGPAELITAPGVTQRSTATA
jgi:hypothetical protein